jgi:hypothetical protein
MHLCWPLLPANKIMLMNAEANASHATWFNALLHSTRALCTGMHRLMGSLRGFVATNILLLFCRPACGQQSPWPHAITPAEYLVLKVTQFGITGVDTSIQLPAYWITSLRNTTFPSSAVVAANASELGRQAYSSGRLVISGAGSDPWASVLDAGMRGTCSHWCLVHSLSHSCMLQKCIY